MGEAASCGEEEPAGPLPMLASACPGWVCYAEKTHGSYILPYISTAKSPQVSNCLLLRQGFVRITPNFASLSKYLVIECTCTYSDSC